MFDRNTFDPFAEIDKADAAGARNPYLLPGKYLLKTKKLAVFMSREKKLLFLAEFLIEQSNNPDRPEGMTVSWLTPMVSDMGPVNIKRLIAALNGIATDDPRANTEITGEVTKFAVSDDQPLKDTQVWAEAANIVTKKKQEEFLVVNWAPVA
jgi:hypothetical protein